MKLGTLLLVVTINALVALLTCPAPPQHALIVLDPNEALALRPPTGEEVVAFMFLPPG